MRAFIYYEFDRSTDNTFLVVVDIILRWRQFKPGFKMFKTNLYGSLNIVLSILKVSNNGYFTQHEPKQTM